MKKQLHKGLTGLKALVFTVVILLGASLLLNSCEKDNPIAIASALPANTDRLMSVANVYYTDDGKNVEAWFFETPSVYEFSINSPNAKSNFENLEYAKENKIPVNVRVAAIGRTMIDLIIPATPEQIATFKAEVSKTEMATQVDTTGSLPASKESATTLISTVPNMTTLNNIFNSHRAQCALLMGPPQYGVFVPFQYVEDGCYARAHKARQMVESGYGYTSYKIFNYACNGSNTLRVKATLWGNDCCAKWWYHVASYVYVGTSTTKYVIDPSMFSGPVTSATWLAAQKSTICGYNNTAQGTVYYSSNAYALNISSLNTSNCTIVPTALNTYTSANAKCNSYSNLQGCGN